MNRFAVEVSWCRWLVAFVACASMTSGCVSTTPPDPLEDGATAYRSGRTADAELIWLDALSQSEAYGEDDPRLAQSLFVLANLAIHQQRFDEA